MKSPDFDLEKSLIPQGCRYLMGIDEVGRGPWAGPVTVGAFIVDLQVFDPAVFIRLKVRDSKSLSELQRLSIFNYFRQSGYKFETFSAPSFIIDRQGIAGAIEMLMQNALIHFNGQFDYCLIDGNMNEESICGNNFSASGSIVRSYIDADALCFSVAAASICAKVVRDQEMDSMDLVYPEYGFKNHKGYGTAAHQSALRLHGPCPIHRRSFKPIKQLL